MSTAPTSERSLIFLLGAVQFVNVLDFMMVMPLGPDFARALSIDPSHLGIIGGSYVASASIAGIIGSFFLEQFDRRKALAWAMLGLVVGTLLGGFAKDLYSLVAARIVAGAFGGPATSLVFAIIADRVPPERRGRAMGAVMGAFAVASTIGVPAGLELARLGTWRTPFFAVSGLGLCIAALGIRLLPPMTGHLLPRDADEIVTSLWHLVRRPTSLLAFLATTAMFMSMFLLVPNISPFVQLNLKFPRDSLGSLYMYGGIVSFLVTRFAGFLVDRFNAFSVATFGCFAATAVIWSGFGSVPPLLSVPALFILYFFAMGFRNVPVTTLMSLIPHPNERARFMSILSSVQHMAAACGAFISSLVLKARPDHTLDGMPTLAYLAMGFTLLMPPMLWMIEKQVRQKTKIAAPTP